MQECRLLCKCNEHLYTCNIVLQQFHVVQYFYIIYAIKSQKFRVCHVYGKSVSG